MSSLRVALLAALAIALVAASSSEQELDNVEVKLLTDWLVHHKQEQANDAAGKSAAEKASSAADDDSKEKASDKGAAEKESDSKESGSDSSEEESNEAGGDDSKDNDASDADQSDDAATAEAPDADSGEPAASKKRAGSKKRDFFLNLQQLMRALGVKLLESLKAQDEQNGQNGQKRAITADEEDYLCEQAMLIDLYKGKTFWGSNGCPDVTNILGNRFDCSKLDTDRKQVASTIGKCVRALADNYEECWGFDAGDKAAAAVTAKVLASLDKSCQALKRTL